MSNYNFQKLRELLIIGSRYIILKPNINECLGEGKKPNQTKPNKTSSSTWEYFKWDRSVGRRILFFILLFIQVGKIH